MLADQSAKVARDLKQETEALTAMVSSFTLGGERRQAGPHLVHQTAAAVGGVEAAARPVMRPARRLAAGGGDGWAEF